MQNPMELQNRIRAALGNHPWRDLIHVVESADSTNDQLKIMAEAGAPHGTCLIALEQTDGRGRQGRTFTSPKGQGLYFSLLLRPKCAPNQVGHITLMAALAGCDAIETAAGVRPGIKWTNDLVLNRKKVSGILTEMEADWATNTINHIIVGIGVNLSQRFDDFPKEIQNLATSIRLATRKDVSLSNLASALVNRFSQMSSALLTEKALWLQRYRQDCVTLGKEVRILRGQESRYGWALDVDEDGGLLVKYTNGETEILSSGEVSVRGLYGYV